MKKIIHDLLYVLPKPGLKHFFIGKIAFLLLISLSIQAVANAAAPATDVSGAVRGADGKPLSGVSITEKGTRNVTTSKDDGTFKISVANNKSVIVFSFIGYKTIELSAGANMSSVVMEQISTELDNVVVIGYGTQKKRFVAGSTSSVNLEAMKEAPNTNVGQMLQGTVPGLNVGLSTIAGGTPPINIRGQNSLNGNQATLIILDGIQYTQSLSSINPDDIASIDVLKDASSTAVYGAQAANGVILITTRKGRSGLKPRISFTSSYSTQSPTVNLRPMNLEQYLANIKEGNWDKSYTGPDFTTPNPAFNVAAYVDPSMRDASNNLLANNFDWWNASTKTGKIGEVNLSISGGNDRFTYLLSGGVVDQAGFIVNDKFKRKSLRVSLETKPLTWWKVGVVSSGSFVNQDGAEPAIANVIQASPLHVPFDADGNLIPSPTNTLVPNPFQTYYVDDLDRNNYLFANIYSDMDLPFLKGLNYRINYGNNYRTSNRYFSSIFAASLQGQAFKNNDEYYDYTLDNILTYTKKIGSKHDINATLLYGAIERRGNSTSARSEVFSRLNLSYNNLGQGTNAFVTSSGYTEALNYQMARVNYRYNDKYILIATVRRDGFSGFAENHKWGYFPTVSAAWIVSEEKFMKESKKVNFLKLRVGYGQSGNQTARYSSIARVSSTPWVPSPPNNNYAFPYVFGDGSSTAAAQQVTALGNPDLKWERTIELNLGADFTVFNNRLSGSLDFYNKNTKDLLFNVNIPTISGFSSIQTNLGQLRNTGFEASLTYKVFDQTDFKWSSTFNFWKNTNRIVALTGQDLNKDGIEDDLTGSGLFIGKSRYSIWDYQYNGIYNLTDTRLPGFTVGSYKIIDQDKNGTITDPNDKLIIGRREAAYQFSWYNTFSYKAFSFSFFINSIQGGKDGYLGNNNPSYFRDDNGTRNNYLFGINYWSPTNPTGKYPRNITGARSYNEQALNNWQDRSFVRLQDVSLSYNLASAGFLKKLGAQSVNFYVSGKNLITWTKWEGWDPEPVDGANNATGGWLGTRPVMRAFTVGLNITY
jgi:TonB-linked SusC/RagA family outer membrane protein